MAVNIKIAVKGILLQQTTDVGEIMTLVEETVSQVYFLFECDMTDKYKAIFLRTNLLVVF